MVLFLELDDEALDHHKDQGGAVGFQKPYHSRTITMGLKNDDKMNDDRLNPQFSTFSRALGCYPIVTELTSSLDLNSLHNLSLTCRQFRINLLQCRRQLLTKTLRCTYDHGPTPDIFGHKISSGKVGPCARDMVGYCQRCGETCCRNCTIKPPSSPAMLLNRHRRLCSICLNAPLSKLMDPMCVASTPPSFTTSAFTRKPCSCTEFIFLCQKCKQANTHADTMYESIWTWRIRYRAYLGGSGTGIGEGNEGVQCGRGDQCLAAKDSEVEIDCSGEKLSTCVWTPREDMNKTESMYSNWWGDTGEKAGYLRQEILGIGGIVKRKVKKRVRVGKTVDKYDDEREVQEYLGREMRGEVRSWCGWCERVIMSSSERVASWRE